jgi:hypothetical protein
VASATARSYALGGSDVGLIIRAVVTATNAKGSSSAASAPTATVVLSPPVSVSPPLVSGAATEGATLLAAAGGWLADPQKYAYEWQRCAPAGCTAIRWANDAHYVLKRDDVGLVVRVVVTASNAGGSTFAYSAPTGLVQPLPPASEGAPTVGGVASQGEQLVAWRGKWRSAAAVAYAYRWQSSGDGETWSDVPGADEATHVLGAGDVGLVFRVVVTATNAGGSSEAASLPTEPVAPPGPPVNVSAPSVSGAVQQFGRLTANNGTWSGSPTFQYRWQRAPAGGAWTDVAGATTFRYTLGAADVGRRIRVLVTAANDLGSATAAADGWLIHPTGGGKIIVVNSTWYCDTEVDYDLVRVTIADGQSRDAVRFDNCSGRIGRVEIDTNGVDGLKVRNTDPVAHDLTVEGGYVRCDGRFGDAHQDGIQVMGGERITFANLVVWCSDPLGVPGDGTNSSALIQRAGAGASTPTDVVIERSVMGPGTANGVLIEDSLRSGIRNAIACPDWTVAGGPVFASAGAIDWIDEGNEKPAAEDPVCTSFEAAVAWVGG